MNKISNDKKSNLKIIVTVDFLSIIDDNAIERKIHT